MSRGIYRLQQHLAHISGDTKGCTNVPTKVRKEMRSLLFGKKADKQKKKEYQDRVAEMDIFNEDEEEGLNDEQRKL